MSVPSRHSHYGVRLFTDAMGGAVLIGGVTQQAVSTDTDVPVEVTSGEVYSRFLSVVGQKPSASFSTHSIATVLDNIGVEGKAITSTTNAGLELFAYKHADGSTRAGNLSHKKYTLRKGIIIPQRITCEHQKSAVISLLALAVYDGTNNPVVFTESVTLPAGITDAERFSLGPVTLGSGVTLSGKLSLEIDFGIKAEAISSDGDVWDTLSSIVQTTPKITVKGLDVGWLKTAGAIPLLGGAHDHGNTVFYLRKRAAGSTFHADNVQQHISFTAAGLAFVEQQEASGGGPKTTSITSPFYNDGTNAIMVIDTTAAIV